jgi:hypothetical protein
MTIETHTLTEGTILYRSSIDICKMFKKNLNEFTEKCEDTEIVGLYFSNSVMVPFGMSFEYLNKYGHKKKRNYPAGAFFNKDVKNTIFKNKIKSD